LKELRAAQPAAGTPDPKATEAAPTTDAEIERLANLKAEAISAQRLFNQRCNDAALAGRRDFGEQEFNSAIAGLQQIYDASDPQSNAAYLALVDAALETGEGPRVLYELGKDLDEASRLLALSPAKMGLELGKRLSGSATPAVSGAPKPITPVGSRGRSHEAISASDPERADKLTTEAWMRRREAEVLARQTAERGR
jgi:hypothetical protein